MSYINKFLSIVLLITGLILIPSVILIILNTDYVLVIIINSMVILILFVSSYIQQKKYNEGDKEVLE